MSGNGTPDAIETPNVSNLVVVTEFMFNEQHNHGTGCEPNTDPNIIDGGKQLDAAKAVQCRYHVVLEHGDKPTIFHP
tara:strand:+ start:250 stop:480 length:231 start_codon:yes stop_codon:yes gene_type:complete